MVRTDIGNGLWVDRKALRAVMSALGRKGGASLSPAKRRASRENVKKALAVRMANLGKVVES